jgi:putative tryptophan/tyrosine transport system substrate-binding protein
MKTKIAVLVFAFLVFQSAHVADAQQPAKVPRIGVLGGRTASFMAPYMDALRQGLRELGYNEGMNITYEYRYTEADMNRIPGFVDEMVRLKVDVILTGAGAPSILAAKKATSTIPIIFIGATDPVAAGYVLSLERPGGNVTGLTVGYPGLYGKRAELLKETVPGLSRVGLLFNSAQSSVPSDELRKAAQTLALQVQSLDVRSPDDFDSAFEAATKAQAGGLIVASSSSITTYPKRIVELAAKSRLPAIYSDSASYEAGGLMAYFPSSTDLYRRSATYIDKILKGAKPGDLPVEEPKKIDLLINLKAAQHIGLTIPQAVINRADQVIR